MLAPSPQTEARSSESDYSDSSADPYDSPWFRNSPARGIKPPPPPDPDLVALQPLSAIALRTSLLASTRIKEDTKDTAVLGYLREARLAAGLVYRYTLSPPARHPGPTRKQLKALQDDADLEEYIYNHNAWLKSIEQPTNRDQPQAPAPQLKDEPDAPASVPTPSPQKTPPPPARDTCDPPDPSPPHQPEPDPPPVPSAPVPSPRSWFFEPDNPSDSSAPAESSAFNGPPLAPIAQPPLPTPELPRAP